MSNIKFIYENDYTVLDNDFIDNYMIKASSPMYALVYIYAFRCANSNIDITNSQIAKSLNIIESDVINAWKYWKDNGLIKISGDKRTPTIEFLKVKDRAIKEVTAEKNQTKREKLKIVTVKPSYSPTEIDILSTENPEIKELLAYAENVLAKILTPKEMEVLVWMYAELNLPLDVLYILITYCKNNDKPVRYMEKTAISWAERGIDTLDKADKYLSIFTSYTKVLSFLGVADRTPTPNDKKYIDRWFLDYEMTIEMIEVACSKTLENTGKAALSYTNRIIENWYKDGIKTIEDIQQSDRNHQSKNESIVIKSNFVKKNSFTDYNQREYTEEQLEEIIARKKAKING